MSEHAAMQALLHPYRTALLAWPNTDQRGVLINAQWLDELAAQDINLRSVQPQRYLYNALQPRLSPARLSAELQNSDVDLDFVWFLPERQRARTRAQLVDAWHRLKPGGILLVAQANNEGARSTETDLATLAGAVVCESKNKCRIFWVEKSSIDQNIAAQWLQADQPQLVEGTALYSRPGVFAWDRIDLASALLAQHLPTHISGKLADLGAGYGYLGAQLLSRASAIASLDCYEACYRSVQLCEQNLRGDHNTKFFWHDVCSGLLDQYDCIVSNPPFHQSRADAPDLGLQFLRVAGQHLREAGRLYIVANQHLPYEATLKQHFKTLNKLAVQDGFKVIEAIR
jgi:16S rRNA (guanine1207-N2)-methyltransferase